MRRPVASLLFLGVLPLAAARGQEPRAVIERAVRALGGLEKLEQVQAVHRLSRGSYLKEGAVFTAESFSQAQRIKIIHRSGNADDPSVRVMVLDGDKGWISLGGVTIDFDQESLARFRRARHADRVSGLVALLRDKQKRYTLTALGPTKVRGKPVDGVRVSSAGQPDISLYFDQKTGLLVKTAQKVMDSKIDNEALHEWYYSDYQWFDPAADDQNVLQKARAAVDNASLLEFLRRRTPGPEIRQRLERLVKKLGAPAFRTRNEATQELKKIGPLAGPLLRQALKDPDREVSRRAEQCLRQLGRHPDATLVPAVVRLLAVRRPEGAARTLLAFLPWAADDRTEDEVLATLAVLAMHNGKPDPTVLAALGDADPRVRRAAAAVLGKDGGAYLKRPGRRVIVQGLRLCRRSEMYRDRQREMVLETLQVEFLNRLNDAVFARP